eukprot:2660882-Rhodomonas_salina.1
MHRTVLQNLPDLRRDRRGRIDRHRRRGGHRHSSPVSRDDGDEVTALREGATEVIVVDSTDVDKLNDVAASRRGAEADR